MTILYTNNTEKELCGLVNWLNNNSYKFNAKNILVTCRPDET